MSVADQFVHDYSKVLVEVWTDPPFMELLKSNPVAALRTQGIALPANATVTVNTTATGAPDLKAQIAAWEEGAKTNRYTLYVPPSPKLGVHGGTGGIGQLDNSYCCCCCPCCTCT